nr:CP52k-like protein 16 isoform 2 [Membranobalanus longirostrum]
MFRFTFLTVLSAAASLAPSSASPVQQPVITGSDISTILSATPLPTLSFRTVSTTTLAKHLQANGASLHTFRSILQRYGKVIADEVKKQGYTSVFGDLWQLINLDFYAGSIDFYYGDVYGINTDLPLNSYFLQYIASLDASALGSDYTEEYALARLSGFWSFLLANADLSPFRPAYPGYELISVLQEIGLHALTYPRPSLGGLVGRLNVAQISRETFNSAVRQYNSTIVSKVAQYQNQYQGVKRDLWKLVVLEYYGTTSEPNVNAALKTSFDTYTADEHIPAPSSYTDVYVLTFLLGFPSPTGGK